jgi:long-chain acyl-CoA synthetase
MKRVVLAVPDPWNYIDQFQDYSLMILNPQVTPNRFDYLTNAADWSVLVTSTKERYRNGGNSHNEKLFWYTSGTTGDSKFYSISQEKIDHVCNCLIADYDINNNDRYVSIMPLWHAHGQMFYWLAKKVGFEINFLPMPKLAQVEKYSPTFISAIPDALKVLSKFDFDDLRFVRSASSALPDTVYQQLTHNFNVPVIEAFGMTESTSHCFTNPLYGQQKVGTVGLPSGIEAQIRDQRLWIRGPAVAATDWFDTGDLAETDNQGYYKILGRANDTINIKGYKINPVSIEQQILKAFPLITECAVFGTNQLKCLYAGKVDTKTVSTFLTNLGSHCRPKLIQQVSKVPVNSMGKVSRTMLNQEFQ